MPRQRPGCRQFGARFTAQRLDDAAAQHAVLAFLGFEFAQLLDRLCGNTNRFGVPGESPEHFCGLILVHHPRAPGRDRRCSQRRHLGHRWTMLARRRPQIQNRFHAAAPHASSASRESSGGTGGPHGVHA